MAPALVHASSCNFYDIIFTFLNVLNVKASQIRHEACTMMTWLVVYSIKLPKISSVIIIIVHLAWGCRDLDVSCA